MRIPFYLKSRIFSAIKLTLLSLPFLFSSHGLWAAQEALVTAEQAVVYADEEMTSAVGYIARGKRVKIGDIARNKAQVYPIIVSGKMAFIRVRDVSTETESLDSSKLVAERFQKQTQVHRIRTTFNASVLNYNSQILLKTTNGGVDDKDTVSFSGFSLRAAGVIKDRWELLVIGNYMSAEAQEEEFKIVETGVGLAYRFIDYNRFTARLETQLLAIPFTTYSHEPEFRVKGRGYSAGAGIALSMRLTEHWGIDGFSGVYYTSLTGFNVPRPFSPIEPVFYGTRLGAGIHYTF